MDVPLSYLLSTFQAEAISLKTLSGDDLYSIQNTGNKPFETDMFSFILSNLAIKAILDILANGTVPESHQQNTLLFHSHGRPMAWVNEIFPYTVEFLTETGNANGPRIIHTLAIWVNESLALKEHFKKVLRDSYKPDFHQFDFFSQVSTNGEALRREVNGWVQEKTKGLIVDSLGNNIVRTNTALILAAVLDFEGEWFEPFLSAGAQKFSLPSGKEVDVEFMTSNGKHYVQQFENYKLLSVPFKQHTASRFSMLFYLPDHAHDIEKLRDFIGQQEAVIKDVYFPEEQVQVGNFFIPKFKLHVRGVMDLVGEDGTTFDFPEMADFPSGLNSQDVVVNNFIEINEKGIRAAAFSAFKSSGEPTMPFSEKVAPRSMILPHSQDNIEFVANRPFIFFIRDNRFKRMLFSGALVDPIGASASYKTVGA